METLDDIDVFLDDEEILAREKAATCINIDHLNCPYRKTGVLSCDYCGWYEKEN